MKLSEGTWAFPDTPKLVGDLAKLLSKPLLGKDATDKLYSIFGDDELFDNIDDEESDVDVRFAVRNRLKQFLKAKNVTKALPSEVVTSLQALTESLNEKVHTLSNPNIKPRGAPADKARAFDKVNARTGARKNRSVLKAMEKDRPGEEYFALEVSEDPDYTMVLVMKGGSSSDGDYYGVNVLFYPDGKIDASTADSLAGKQWEKNKREIIKVARKQLKSGAPMGDTDADVRAYHGAGDGDYSGYTDKKMNEGKVTFKQFLLAEVKKIKEPGWYVCDHMDKPVSGPMQERGAKEEAAEMNAKHAKKHGKGDIDPFSAEYFSDYEIRRMNEETELSAAQKKRLLWDFDQWSGGFTPDDLPWKSDDADEQTVQQYIEYALPTVLPRDAAIAYLKHIMDNGAKNAP